MASSQKRSFSSMQNADIDKEFLQEAWYAIKPGEIVAMVESMCDKLATPLEKYATIDPSFQAVVDAVNAKRRLPDIRQFNIAVLGEQGIGKSSIINALLDRELLDRSSSSKACTAYATVLEYKKGASDKTTTSDLSVEFLTEEQISHCIKEQIDRWTEVHPGPNQARTPPHNEDINEEEDEGEDDAVLPSIDKPSKANSRGAVTAEEFFGVIFNVEKDVQIIDSLENMLYHTDIKGDFFDLCYQQAKNRLAEMAMEKTEFNLQTRKALFVNVSDQKLCEETVFIKQLWPFVKNVTIATGHFLLRHGLRLFDLPGYGDTSQLREVVINDFRRKADFEMVIAPFSRLNTSVLQERYINRSIHLKGANRTILVLNKSDILLNEDNIRLQIQKISEEPFPYLLARLNHLDALEDEDGEDIATLTALTDDIVREATIAYIKYETANIQQQMNSKGIRVFQVSALAHIASRNRRRRKTHVLDEKTAGVLELRYFLAKLPTVTNYQNYRNHVYEILPELRNEAARLLEKHIEDKTYAAMRHELREQIPLLRDELQARSENLLRSLVERPWSSQQEQEIISNIKQLTENLWVHPRIHCNGVAKMLRENGIPVSGKYQGYNMNSDLLGAMENYIDEWYNNSSLKVIEFAHGMRTPTGSFLQRTMPTIKKSTVDPVLKRKVTEELDSVRRRIDKLYSTLLAGLSSSLAKTHLHFTTEIDISCPIAMEMKVCYDYALNPGLVCPGPGSYIRRRHVLCESIVNPPGIALRPLVKKIGERIQVQQQENWKRDCDTFISDTVNQLDGFSKTAEQLLMDPSYVTARHGQARHELKRLLTVFDHELEDIQSCFRSVEEHTQKRVKPEEFEV